MLDYVREESWMKFMKPKVLLLLIVVAIFVIAQSVYASNSDKDKSEKVKISLPKQPEIWEIYKTLDKEKIQKDDIGLSAIGLNTQQIEKNKAEIDEMKKNENYIRRFPGFFGPYAVEYVDGINVSVVPNSLNIIASEENNWTAMGLVRNETMSNIGNSFVEATLINSEGKEVEKVKGKVLVDDIRPGEPAPFVLTSRTNIEDVETVDWVVKVQEKEEKISRDANITIDYELAFGDEYYKGQPRYDAPFPYRLSVSFDNLGVKVKDVELTVAWLTPEGKVFWIEQSKLDPVFANGISEEGAGYFMNIVNNDKEIAPKLTESLNMFWVVGK